MKEEHRHIRKLLGWLRDRENDFELALESASIGTWHHDLGSDVLTWSDRCRALLGLPAEVPPSFAAFLSVVHPDDRLALQQARECAQAPREEREREFRVVRPSGEVRWMQLTSRIYQLHGESHLHISGMLMDVTERHWRERAEQDLKRSEAERQNAEQFRMVSEGAPMGILMTDRDGACTYANATWLEITGLCLEQALNLGWAEAIHPDDRERVMNSWEDLAKGAAFDIEFRYCRPSGEVRTVQARARALRNDQSTVTGYVSAELDVTDRQQQRVALDRFHSQVRSLAQRLENMRDHERRELADALQGGLRHDLVNLKSGLESLADYLRSDSRASARIQDLAAQADQSLENLRHIAFELHPPGIEELGFLEAVQRYSAEKAAEHGLDVEFSLPQALPKIEMRRQVVLYRVLQEALSNVVRHAHARRVEVTVSAQEGELKLRVMDDGIGLQNDDRLKPGCLGLLAASERMAQIGGSLRAFGISGRGTVLEARVPLEFASLQSARLG